MPKPVDIKTAKGQDALPPRIDPYYQKVAKGLAVGLWKSHTGTRSWLARIRSEGKYRVEVLEASTYHAQVLAGMAW